LEQGRSGGRGEQKQDVEGLSVIRLKRWR
jgi:hypothetical protein